MKKIRKNTFSVLVAALSIVLALITVVYAVVLFSFRVDGKIDGNTDTINSEEWLVTTYGDEIPLLSVVPDVNAKSDRRYYKYGGYYGTATKNGENSN